MDIHAKIKTAKRQMAEAARVIEAEIDATKKRLDELERERTSLYAIGRADMKAPKRAPQKGEPDTVRKLGQLPQNFSIEEARKVFKKPVALAQLSRRGLIRKVGVGYEKVGDAA